jgi:hypothetical protein
LWRGVGWFMLVGCLANESEVSANYEFFSCSLNVLRVLYYDPLYRSYWYRGKHLCNRKRYFCESICNRECRYNNPVYPQQTQQKEAVDISIHSLLINLGFLCYNSDPHFTRWSTLSEISSLTLVGLTYFDIDGYTFGVCKALRAILQYFFLASFIWYEIYTLQ